MMITEQQKEAIEKIGKKYNLKLILLHGSYATGKIRPGSDLDIAVLGNKPIEPEKFWALFGDLEDIFGNNQQRELDVKDLKNADALFLYQVMKNSILLYGASLDYWQLKTFAIRNYWDHFPIFELEALLNKKYFCV